MPNVKLKAGLLAQTLTEDLISNGKVLAHAGDLLIILPETNSRCVVFDDGESLHSHWVDKADAIHTHAAMQGATYEANGEAGIVPAPATNDRFKFLRGDGTWHYVSDGNEIGNLNVEDILATEAETVDDVAAIHNNLYRGKNLTGIYTLQDISDKLAADDFSDLYIGDYITRQYTHAGVTKDVNFRIAHFNYWKYMGYVDATNGLAINNTKPNTFGPVQKNHIVFVPDECLFNAAMNSTATTAGGLRGSSLWRTLQTTVYSELVDIFGIDHILGYSYRISTAINANSYSMVGNGNVGCASTSYWADECVGLLSEIMVYGSTISSSSYVDVSLKNSQFALFKINRDLILSTNTFWLGAIATSKNFCIAVVTGHPMHDNASNAQGVRPFFLFA